MQEWSTARCDFPVPNLNDCEYRKTALSVLVVSVTLTAAIIASSSALFGSLLGIGFTCAASVLGRKLEHSKLIAPWIARDELEKARIAAYRELWICLGGISTFHSSEMIAQNLATVQKQLQEWYYQRGGGLFIEGAANKSRSSKAAFFGTRLVNPCCESR
jgi:hypothetical protein